MKEIAIPTSIAEICETRDLVGKWIAEAHRLLREAEEALGKVAQYSWHYEANPRLSVEETMREVDRRLWRQTYDRTGLGQMMDKKAKSEFERSLEKDPPPFTLDNVKTALLSTAQEADMMFARGIVEFFRSLSKEHRTNTNEPFKVNSKAILSYCASNFMGTLTVSLGPYSGSHKLSDMDRVFKTLDGKKFQDRELESAINKSWSDGPPYIHEDEYYRIKGFKNQNAHVQFKRQDLLDKANRIIHDYYEGAALAKGRPAA